MNASGDTVSTSVSFGSNPQEEVWMLVLKKTDSVPSDFYLMGPDDGMAAGTAPTFTWQKSQGAESDTLTIAEDKKFKKVAYEKTGITGESFTLDKPLKEGKDYYYYAYMSAINADGERVMAGNPHEFTTTTADGKPADFNTTSPANKGSVDYGTAPGKYTAQVETTETAAFVPLNDGTTYYWTVAAVKDGVESDTWGELTATAGSSNLDVVLDKALEAEQFPNPKNVSFSAADGSSAGLSVRFSEAGSEIGLTAVEDSATVKLRYQAEQDTTVSLYQGDQKVQDIQLYQTEAGKWNEITVEASFAGGDSLRLVKKTKEAEFKIDYIVLSGEKIPLYENLALKNRRWQTRLP